MQNITLINALSQETFNGTKKFEEVLSRPQQFNVREIVRGMLVSGKIWLKSIGEANGSSALPRKTVEKLSNTLEKMPLEECMELHVQQQAKRFKHEPVLLLSDGGDFQKPYARKMEKVGSVVDGSNGHKVGKGYPAHSIVAYGLNSKSICPLTLTVYSSLDEKYKSEWDEQKKSFDMVSYFTFNSLYDRIFVEDRGCDSEKRFIYVTKKLGASFVTRVMAGKNSRTVLMLDKQRRLESFSIQQLAEKVKPSAGDANVWWNNKIKKKLTSKIAFQRVYLPDHLDVPLYAIFCFTEGFDEPLVILTDLSIKNSIDAWKYFFYYKKRWEVENFYRGIKQQFTAEKFLVISFRKIRALLFLLMVTYCILIRLKEKFKELCQMVYGIFKAFCKRHQRKGTHHFDVLAFLRHELAWSHETETYAFYSRRFRKKLFRITKNQLQLFDFRKKW
jgi:hypothetical protein